MGEAGHQHHHGVRKNLVEGIGGLVVGAALVVFVAGLFKRRRSTDEQRSPAKADQ